MMIQNPASGLLAFQLFLTSFSLQFISGFSDHSMNSKHEASTKHHHVASKSNTGTKVVIILLGLVAVGLFCFFLFKLYQKKKRQEQYARLLKLFEEDDELEVELGLRD